MKFKILILLLSIGALSAHSYKPRSYTQEEREVIVALYDAGVFRFDTETLNCPLVSPYYIDFRHIMSCPKLFKRVVKLLSQKLSDINYDVICGVPYAALALAADIAYIRESPLIMRRDKRKEHGTGKKIEGIIVKGMRAIIIEDVVTTATSLFETLQDLENEHLVVQDCVILFDRQQGGVEYAENKGYRMHVLFNITDFMHILQEEGKIDPVFAHTIVEWTKEHQVAGVNWKNN